MIILVQVIICEIESIFNQNTFLHERFYLLITVFIVRCLRCSAELITLKDRRWFCVVLCSLTCPELKWATSCIWSIRLELELDRRSRLGTQTWVWPLLLSCTSECQPSLTYSPACRQLKEQSCEKHRELLKDSRQTTSAVPVRRHTTCKCLFTDFTAWLSDYNNNNNNVKLLWTSNKIINKRWKRCEQLGRVVLVYQLKEKRMHLKHWEG